MKATDGRELGPAAAPPWNESGIRAGQSDQMSEEALIERAQAGDAEAFGRLVDLHGPSTYRLCYAILRSPTEAEDAAQEAFVRAWRELPRLRDASAWPGWLRRIATRAAIDEWHRRGRRMRIWAGRVDVIAPDHGAAVAARMELEAAFRQLSADDRALLALRFYADLEVPDAAATLGIPLGTAKSRLSRALGKLRIILEQAE